MKRDSSEKFILFQKKQSERSLLSWQDPERRRKQSISVSKAKKGKPAWNKGKTYLELYGAEKAAELKKKSGDSRRGQTWKDSPDIREKKRQSFIRDILLGKRHPHLNARKARQVTIRTEKAGVIRCQSSWEVVLARYLDQHALVESFEKDFVRIPYTFSGKKRIYIVDFLVRYSDGSKELVEVKPKYQLAEEDNLTKFLVAESWCKENEADFVIITEDEIKVIT